MEQEPRKPGTPRVWRWGLFEEPLERPIGGEAAVRRYRLARLERVAEATPPDPDWNAPRGENRRNGSEENRRNGSEGGVD